MHPIVTRIARIAVAFAAISAAAATPAFAADTPGAAGKATMSPTSVQTAGCPSNGYVSPLVRCTSLSNGALFTSRDFGGGDLKTWYVKTGGSAITARLGVSHGSALDWSGWFTQTSGTTVAFHEALIISCGPTTGWMDVQGSNSLAYTTPSTPSC
ncbi:hypothetical protein [Streptomyces sp. H39-S7]|uniref:hypothetical protein n=1 Tax=Streptomyces sp. H39-S7 TaxID=3004357 RepID=UPI0022AF8197|nr:hypothetical protein [Streptomyces sp. H39-S7]MCZ4120227.1 hypothetical protein [Streptomyces sp. H39-S7]